MEAHLPEHATLASARLMEVLRAVHVLQISLTRLRLAMWHALCARAPDLIAEVCTTAFALPVLVRRISVPRALHAPQALTRRLPATVYALHAQQIVRAAEAHLPERATLALARQMEVLHALPAQQKSLSRKLQTIVHAFLVHLMQLVAVVRLQVREVHAAPATKSQLLHCSATLIVQSILIMLMKIMPNVIIFMAALVIH